MKAIAQAGELLRQGQAVILYDCGGDGALLALSSLDGQFGLSPTALADNHKDLWGKHLQGHCIHSPQELIRQYPDAQWFVCNLLDRASGIHTLETLGIPAERILNYLPHERRVSCRYLEGYFYPADDRLYLCCGASGRDEPPYIQRNGSCAEDVTASEKFRQAVIVQLGKGSVCDGCSNLKEGSYPLERKVGILNYGGGGVCNFRCVYCHANARKGLPAKHGLDFPEIFSALKEQNLLSEDVHVQFDSGEIGVHPRRTEMFAALGSTTVSVLTNSSVYIPELAEKLRSGDAVINTSLDAGTRETFRRVKGVDAWDRVCGNLRRYGEIRRSNIVLKYIFLPGINDTAEEVEGFVQVCKELAGFVQLSSDIYHPERITRETRQAFCSMKDALEREGILYHISAGAFSDRK